MIPALQLAAAAEGATRILAVFLGIAVVGATATFATTRLYARLQRRRWIAALTAGGWFASGAGIIIGPRVLAAIDGDAILALRPILGMALAWIGLIVGLQARRTLVQAIPDTLRRWLGRDTFASIGIGAVVAGAWWFLARPEATAAAIGPAALVVVLAFVGWAPETRTLRAGLSPRTVAPAQLVQAGGGLGAILAIAAFGLAEPMIRATADPNPIHGLMMAGLELLLAGGTAVMLGFGARLLLRQSEGGDSEALVVTLGLVLLCAGFANELGFSPLLSGLLAGAVIANLRDPHLRDLERGLQSGEPGMAVLMLLSCGSLAADADAAQAIALGVSIAGLRLAIKPWTAWKSLRPTFPDLSPREPLLLGPARLPMIAVALAVGPAVMSTDEADATVLAAVLGALLLGSLVPAISARRRGGADLAGSEVST